jgi:uncharacterized membrane protein
MKPSSLAFIISALGVIFIVYGVVLNIWMATVGGVGLLVEVIVGLKEINDEEKKEGDEEKWLL